MTVAAKPIDQIPFPELLQHQVWEYVAEPTEDQDETWVYPVSELPVSSLANRLVSCPIQLANGQMVHALLGNLDLRNPVNSQHFLVASIVKPNGEWFHLARYHDLDYSESGPDALATLLGLSRAEIFPIAFDVSAFALGCADCVIGTIPDEPSVRLSRSELLRLTVS